VHLGTRQETFPYCTLMCLLTFVITANVKSQTMLMCLVETKKAKELILCCSIMDRALLLICCCYIT
jgi:hypothetical protein